jgi:hypothetical protein
MEDGPPGEVTCQTMFLRWRFEKFETKTAVKVKHSTQEEHRRFGCQRVELLPPLLTIVANGVTDVTPAS